MSKVIIKQGLLPNSKTAFVITKAPATSTKFDDVDNDVKGWSSWGSDNLWPTKVRQKLEKSTIAYPVIYKLISMLYGNGIKYYRVKHDGDREVKELFRSDEIDEFFRKNRINNFLVSQIVSYKMFMNCFCDFRLNNGKTEITRLKHLDAEYSRLSIQNKKTRKIEKLGYSGSWETVDEENIEPIPLYDLDEPEKFLEKVPHKFAFHSKFPSPGRSYYAMPFWGGLYRDNGWLDVANEIPEIITTLNKNQIKLKYHIQIPYSYWEGVYPKWDTYTDEERNGFINDKLKGIDDFLANKSNSGKSFVSHYMTDPASGKEISGWKIEAIEDKLNNTSYIPTSEKADEQITQALGYSPSLLGLQPAGGKMGAGSGSDKRESHNIAVRLNKVEEEIILEPLYIIRDFNNWGSDIRFTFSHQESQTLDKNPTGSQSTI